MELPRLKISWNSVNNASFFTHKRIKKVIDLATKYLEDPEYEKRIDGSLCLYCFYGAKDVVAGCAVCTRPCAICDEIILSGSTDCGMLCLPCGIINKLCIRCGSDVNLRQRRKFTAQSGKQGSSE